MKNFEDVKKHFKENYYSKEVVSKAIGYLIALNVMNDGDGLIYRSGERNRTFKDFTDWFNGKEKSQELLSLERIGKAVSKEMDFLSSDEYKISAFTLNARNVSYAISLRRIYDEVTKACDEIKAL